MRYVGALIFLAALGCTRQVPPPDNLWATSMLCRDIGKERCRAKCKETRSPEAHADCLIALRFGSDPNASQLARALYQRTGALPGVETHSTIDGFRGEQVELYPAIPVGDSAHHLAWIDESLETYASFIDALNARSSSKVRFDPKPRAFSFFRTRTPQFPSAYATNAVIGYNLDGPLHSDRRQMHETLFHELFHMNDEREGWSTRTLGTIWNTVITRCEGEHGCLRAFAPYETIVTGGTYYAFDDRTGDPREYGAELAVRYYLEHEAILAGNERLPAFKCETEENALAWREIVDRFFGGVDLTECPE